MESSPVPRIRVRVETLSDLVFGLALSFGALILIGTRPSSGLELLANIFTFGFSFMIVVWTWIGYTRTYDVLSPTAPYALPLNIGLLFCVALEPYLFYLVTSSPLSGGIIEPASVAYAMDAGLMFLFLAGLGYLVVKGDRPTDKPLHPALLRRFRRLTWVQAAVGAIYFASALPIFWTTVTPLGPLRFLMWSCPLVIVVLRHRRLTPSHSVQQG